MHGSIMFLAISLQYISVLFIPPQEMPMNIDDLYFVNSTEDIEGNDAAISAIRRYVKGKKGNVSSLPILVYGPTGVGKTAAVMKIIEEESLNLIELDASDYRNSAMINQKIKPALDTKPLFGKGNVVVFDEVDELSGKYDKGAAITISALIRKSRIPIIFIANDMWSQSLVFLRNKTKPVEFKKPDMQTITSVLKRISNRHRLGVSDRTIAWIAKMCNGDIRSAINDLYVMWGASDDDVDVLGLRNKKVNIFATLDRIFLARTLTAPMRAAMDVDVDSGMLMNWIDENIPIRYSDEESICNAYDNLSMASVFDTRASRSGYYVYWRYRSVLMSGGVALSKTGGCETARRYTFPKRIKELSSTKTQRHTVYSISEKMKRNIHSSTSSIARMELPLMSKILNTALKGGSDRKDINRFFTEKFGMDEKETEWLAGYPGS